MGRILALDITWRTRSTGGASARNILGSSISCASDVGNMYGREVRFQPCLSELVANTYVVPQAYHLGVVSTMDTFFISASRSMASCILESIPIRRRDRPKIVRFCPYIHSHSQLGTLGQTLHADSNDLQYQVNLATHLQEIYFDGITLAPSLILLIVSPLRARNIRKT